jgi:glucosamine-6-phosphate deaminase
MQKYTVIAAKSDKDFGEKARDCFMAALSRHAEPSVILPTGKTPLPLYEELVEKGAGIKPFTYIQLDEYLGLPPGHPRLFFQEMCRNLLRPLGIRIGMHFNAASKDQIFEIHRVASLLKRHGPVDIAVLGIGHNGHVGFNEPPAARFDQSVHVVELTQETIEANKADWVSEDGPFPSRAMTLGIADLQKVKETILLVRGENKADILARALTGPVTEAVPASYLQRQSHVTIIADDAALSGLSLRAV